MIDKLSSEQTCAMAVLYAKMKDWNKPDIKMIIKST